MSFEMNFDGLVGPTHNYGGLAFGNVASGNNSGTVSRPRDAALEGLKKMKFVRDLGLKQGFLPPHPRPFLPVLRRLGFEGPSEEVVKSAGAKSPELLAAVYSASNMWTANAATVSPSADTQNGKLHLTTANLSSMLHRSLEGHYTTETLIHLFAVK